MRVFELSKELGTTSRYLITQLHKLDIEASSVWTDLDEEDVSTLKARFVHRPWEELQTEEENAENTLKERALRDSERRAERDSSERTYLEESRKKAEELERLTLGQTETAEVPGPVTETEPGPEAAPEPTPAANADNEPKPVEAVEAAGSPAEKKEEKAPAEKKEKKPADTEKKTPAKPKKTKIGTKPEKPEEVISEEPKPAPKTVPAVDQKKPKTKVSSKEAKLRAAMRTAQAAKAAKAAPKSSQPELEQVGDKTITLRGDDVLVKDLATKMRTMANRIIAELMRMNVLASINQRIDIDTAVKVAKRLGYEVERSKGRANKEHHQVLKNESAEDVIPQDDPEQMKDRPPVVTFLGHVDHGKTSLMDCIRSTVVADGEAGGITQHIGAYTVNREGHNITFLDTPGHAAFSAMRARGANLTDIAVIIIAADDGIMPQTREAIKHAQDAGVALMVAINKCDLPAANPDRVRTQLQAAGLTPEEWGGDTICCEVSAQTGDGIETLLEMILLQAEVLELQANPNRRANGYVIEAQMEPGRGPTASVLVTGGKLKAGDAMLCGGFYGKIRALIDDKGTAVKSATPSTPVSVLGLSGVPEAGAEFVILKNEKRAKTLAAKASDDKKQNDLMSSKATTVDALMTKFQQQDKRELTVLIRADTQGSVEAIEDSLNEIESEKVALSIILSGTGNITVTDIQRAAAGGALIVGFHVNTEPGVQAAARHNNVRVLTYRIIYELLDRVKQEMLNLLQPEYEEIIRGHAELRQVFSYGKRDRVAGCLIIKGTITNKCTVRVKRKKEIVHEGPIASIRHFQNEVSEIREAQECGILIKDYNEVEEGDILEFFELEEKERTL